MTILIIVISLALAFDVINGFHDAANSIATIVSTKVLPPNTAVTWAAFFNFIAYFVFGLHVANTVSYKAVDKSFRRLQLVSAACYSLGHGANDAQKVMGISALGIPVSTTHTITGAIIGAGATKRLTAIRWCVTTNILIAWIITIPITSLLSALIYYILTLIS